MKDLNLMSTSRLPFFKAQHKNVSVTSQDSFFFYKMQCISLMDC